jgi:hypothetical protein
VEQVGLGPHHLVVATGDAVGTAAAVGTPGSIPSDELATLVGRWRSCFLSAFINTERPEQIGVRAWTLGVEKTIAEPDGRSDLPRRRPPP